MRDAGLLALPAEAPQANEPRGRISREAEPPRDAVAVAVASIGAGRDRPLVDGLEQPQTHERRRDARREGEHPRALHRAHGEHRLAQLDRDPVAQLNELGPVTHPERRALARLELRAREDMPASLGALGAAGVRATT
jgi:hypothetical protein